MISEVVLGFLAVAWSEVLGLRPQEKFILQLAHMRLKRETRA